MKAPLYIHPRHPPPSLRISLWRCHHHAHYIAYRYLQAHTAHLTPSSYILITITILALTFKHLIHPLHLTSHLTPTLPPTSSTPLNSQIPSVRLTIAQMLILTLAIPRIPSKWLGWQVMRPYHSYTLYHSKPHVVLILSLSTTHVPTHHLDLNCATHTQNQSMKMHIRGRPT